MDCRIGLIRLSEAVLAILASDALEFVFGMGFVTSRSGDAESRLTQVFVRSKSVANPWHDPKIACAGGAKSGQKLGSPTAWMISVSLSALSCLVQLFRAWC
jgi:hypothetical protein